MGAGWRRTSSELLSTTASLTLSNIKTRTCALSLPERPARTPAERSRLSNSGKGRDGVGTILWRFSSYYEVDDDLLEVHAARTANLNGVPSSSHSLLSLSLLDQIDYERR